MVSFGLAGCFAHAGDGTDPPPTRFNYPVGLAVSPKGDVLYAVNSDFDLQWNGGTIQSYDLSAVRNDALALINSPSTFDTSKLVDPNGLALCGTPSAPQGSAQTLGDQCAPAVRSEPYLRHAITIAAFATDLQLSLDGTRIFAPVRSDASMTWANLVPDSDGKMTGFDCAQGADGRCNPGHSAGNNSDEPGNTRHITMPGEPFGMAMSEAGDFAVITHQTDTKTSLLTTGMKPVNPTGTNAPLSPTFDIPALQFVFDGVNGGGIAVAAIPHDLDAFPECVDAVGTAACSDVTPRPAFLQTSRSVGKVDLLRVFADEGYRGTTSAPARPYLQKEGEFDITANAGNTDSRGIAIDPTPRLACKDRVDASGVTGTDRTNQLVQCARIPARVYIANRTPASLLIGELGESSADGSSYDPDKLNIRSSIPLSSGLSSGPSRVYLAPVIETDGTYGLRVFVTCFDASVIYVIDPATNFIENIIKTGDGPSSLAFDPFTFDMVAQHLKAPGDPGQHPYRFAYLSIFRNSHLQVIDLDNSVVKDPAKYTYQSVVFTLGEPVAPKGGL